MNEKNLTICRKIACLGLHGGCRATSSPTVETRGDTKQNQVINGGRL
jgi:hypothetical protein